MKFSKIIFFILFLIFSFYQTGYANESESNKIKFTDESFIHEKYRFVKEEKKNSKVIRISDKKTTKPTILIPSKEDKTYEIAGEIFARLWKKTTGQELSIHRIENSRNPKTPDGDVILIGSDAVNSVVHDLIISGALKGLNIKYGADNYRMLTLNRSDGQKLILAGGNGRATIYAVYDFFRKQTGAEYFWDGDIIPHRNQIDLKGIDVYEKPHFKYRGLRYFAHRGLHRFRAEMWDLEDWKKEIDWVLKERFNLFMLRTGIDDLFQRAFKDVPYPPTDAQDPDAQPRSYNDRTSLWPLKYRAELRKQVLKYARDRGLLSPVDVGTITHWYSHTPTSFYNSRPDFPVIDNQKTGYDLNTASIWDIESQRAWDAYWKLSETLIDEYHGGEVRLFHTIGMAERTFGDTPRENLQMKRYAYRKTLQKLRNNYPDKPLLVATWDFVGWWKNKDVRELTGEFDPSRTIMLDYTADNAAEKGYRKWGFYKKFPWIFGIFHSLAKHSDIHENYGMLVPRLQEAVGDTMSIGLVKWSEISHSDTFLLEYLADNSWQPQRLKLDQAISRYTDTRYPTGLSSYMEPLWTSFLKLSQSLQFTHDNINEEVKKSYLWDAIQFRVLSSHEYTDLTPERLTKWEKEYQRLVPGLQKAPEVLSGLAGLTDKWYSNSFWRRDALDMARTIANRAYFAALARGVVQIGAWKHQQATSDQINKLASLSKDLLANMSNILALSNDFSMYASYKQLSNAKDLDGIPPTINPHTEQTLKGNTENNYNRSQQYELVNYVYRPELNAYWKWVFDKIESKDRTGWNRPPQFKGQEKKIEDQFYEKPLKNMAPTRPRNAQKLSETLLRLKDLVEKLLDEI